MSKYAIGIDYGTLSVRALLVNIETGEEVAARIYEYPHLIQCGLYSCSVSGGLRRLFPGGVSVMQEDGEGAEERMRAAGPGATEIRPAGQTKTACFLFTPHR